MTLPCYENFIGSKACGLDAPQSGLFIEELPNMSIGKIADLQDEKFVSAKAIITEKSRIAAQMIADMVRATLAARGFEFNSILDSGNFCEWTTKYLPVGTVGERGLRYSIKGVFEIPSKIKVQSLQIKGLAANTELPIFIKDVRGNILWQKNVPYPVAGEEQTVDVNAVFSEREIYIVIPSDQFTPYLASCSLEYGGCGSCPPVTKCCGERTMAHVNGYDSAAAQTMDWSSKGIKACISVICDDSAFCELLPVVKRAVLYLTGVLILEEAEGTERVNYWAAISGDLRAQRITEWRGEVEAILNLNALALTQQIQKSNPCIGCKPSVGIIPALP